MCRTFGGKRLRSIIKDELNISEDELKKMEEDGYELVITLPYIRKIPEDRDENLKKGRNILGGIKRNGKTKRCWI